MVSDDEADHVRRARALFFTGGRCMPGSVAPCVLASWQRCHNSGVVREGRPGEVPLAPAQLSELFKRNQYWLDPAEVVQARLAQQLVGSDSILALADTQGILLKVQGERVALGEMGLAALAPGFCWGEAVRGTNAISVALEEGRPLAIHGVEHYRDDLLNLSGAAVPVQRPDGGIAGVFAIFGAWSGPQPYLLALAQMAVLMIESRLLSACPSEVPCANAGPATLADLLGSDVAIEAAARRALRIVGKDIPLLIEGGTGTGKEVFARAFHLSSPRAEKPFVAVNCAAIPEGLIESELFGYEEGAFTGARRKGHPGKITQAHGGTLFLDEVGDMPLSLQARLLRVLQEREVTPLGSSRVVPVDIALVCATNRRLQQAVEAGQFREDLFYRINGLRVSLPPLRERSDLLPLVMRLLAEEGAPVHVALSPEVLECFRRYAWPGNVRQLRSVLRTALAHLDGEHTLQLAHLPEDFVEASGANTHIHRSAVVRPTPSAASTIATSTGSLADVERALMRRVLEECRGNVSEASRRLGVSRNTLYRRLGLWGR